MGKLKAEDFAHGKVTTASCSEMDVLREDLNAWCRTGRQIPQPLPEDIDLAAKAWMLVYQRPRARSESVTAVSSSSGEGQGGIDPYITRLRSTLAAFLRMDEKGRRFVKAGIEDGVEWRGEHLVQYAEIYKETMKMRDDKQAYRLAAIAMAADKCGIVIPNIGER